MVNACDALFRVAVITAACVVATAETVAEKETVVWPAGTVADAGTTTAALLLDRETIVSVVVLPFNVIEQLSVPGPVYDAVEHDTDWIATGAKPVPERFMIVGLFGAFDDNDRVPVTVPPAVGVKFNVNVVDWPGFNVTGNVVDVVMP